MPVDNAVAACPDQSTSVPSGASGGPFPLVATAGTLTIPCHHSAIVDQNTGAFITSNGPAGTGQAREIAVAWTGALRFNPLHGTFYAENLNRTVSTLPRPSIDSVRCID